MSVLDGSDEFNKRLEHPWPGSSRKIVVAFAIGTESSQISYCTLEPGSCPRINLVTRHPFFELVGTSNIPNIIYYDQSGRIKAIAAEALQENIMELADENEWYKVERFRLYLVDRRKPKRLQGCDVSIDTDLPPLPPNKTAIDVFADFLAYLFSCTREYITDTLPNGRSKWLTYVENDSIDFVLSHPNDWDSKEQVWMRAAGVQAKLITDTDDGHARLSFVKQGEASLHFASDLGLWAENDQTEDIVIVDVGTRILDFSTYRKKEGLTNSFYETAIPEFHPYGSMFVSFMARSILEEHLKYSPFIEDLDHIVHCFNRSTKQRFRSKEEFQYVKFGSTRDNDEKVNIRFGQLKLLGSTVASFFKPSIDCIVEVIRGRQRSTTISHVVLVGSLGLNSDWLFERVKAELNSSGVTVVRFERPSESCLISGGAVSYYLDHYSRTQTARRSYGEVTSGLYDDTNFGHVRPNSGTAFGVVRFG
ncbi:hypothetical protein CPB83DRAFT_850255 [Crepidotus variabilis]|uniref:Uncharacterized protein n=1 Tax=Crepidotus variabilis TaxID=179855 RepID=A0A9P6EKU6_9AGAR|nr:hypothetical protein CPB83DRAFT_850255 [Crepidotus variabilis]